MTVNRQPKISLVGAGPGDPDLITLKGYRTIQNANVILYDALANPALLEAAPAHAEKIYVGKRANNHRFTQDEINQMLVAYAYTHGHVVRLKGGDPFVFGRGYEELDYAAAFGIQVDYVPGISSSIAVPGLQQVPLTCRGINESFWVLTATTKNGKLSKDIALAAQSSATVVILMGIRKLKTITELFTQLGKADTPAMVIQNGSLENERAVQGTVAELYDKVQRAGIGSPGIIVIGAVAGLSHRSKIKQTVKAVATA
ncbi:MAG: uroporphyrinogen-III C-methyltransferase [Bacteroidota bacterium]